MYFCSFVKFYTLNFVIIVSDWAPNGEFFGIHKSSINPKDLLIISPPV